MLKVIARLLPLLLLLFHFHPNRAEAQQLPSLSLGDAVVTGFSGIIAPDPTKPLPAGKSAIDLTFINPDGPSARIMDVRQATANWDGRDLPATMPFDVYARDVGQVFGIALDDQAAPNIYLAATSAFGLQLVGRGGDGQPARVKKGGPGEGWMKGQFGLELQGGPGSIFKVDGTTGAVSLFANVALDGVPNPAAALGSLAFDAQHQQLFVSDLYTGMIHRFDLNGNDLGHFDHGVTGRTAAKLTPAPFNPSARPNIAVAKFDTQNPATWGFAPATRSVWGLAVHEGRLFYAVADGPQIWSVGIQQDGSFAADPRWELDVPAQPGPYQVSDILFSQQGAMILAQRAPIAASYDYTAFTAKAEPRVLRYRLDNPKTPGNRSRWIAVPEEYAIGFAGDNRNTNGGVALGYDYGPDGALNTASCEATLWTTGQDLRDDPALQTQLLPGGPLVVHGLFAVPVSQVLPSNTPPWTSYSVDYDSAFHDPAATGHLGQVRIFTAPCAAGQNGGPVVSGGAPGGGGVSPGGGGVNPGGGGNCQYGVNPDGSCAPPYDLAIVKTGVVSTTSGGITFTLAVSNPGAAINNPGVIQVADVVPAGMTFTGATGPNWSCAPTGTIPAGGMLICTYTGPVPIAANAVLPPITVTATVAAPGSYQNCASVGFAAGSGLSDSNPANNQSCAPVTIPNYDLAIVKTGVASTTTAGSFTFTLAVTNPGAAITNPAAIVVTDTAPAGMTFTAATGGPNWNCTITGGVTLTCAYIGSGPIASAAVLSTITVTATAPLGGSFKNCATVGFTAASGLSDSNPSNNTSCAPVTNTIDLAIAKTGAPITGPAGGAVTGLEFDLTVTNVGLGFTGATNNVTVSDSVPTGMTFTLLSATPSWNCPTTAGPGPATFTCTYIGSSTVAAGANMGTIAISATPPPPQGQTVTNCATVGLTAASGQQDSNPSNNTACITLQSNGYVHVRPAPKWPTACGFNVIFVVDESLSIALDGGTGDVIAALNNAAAIFNHPPSMAALIRFSNTATVIDGMANSTYGVLNNGYSPHLETNWEAAMQAAYSLLPSPNTIILFITDGDPDYYQAGGGGYIYTSNPIDAVNPAIAYVNDIYTAGVPIIGIGISGGGANASFTNMNALLGANVTMTTYGGLSGALNGIAQQLCPGLYLTKSIAINGSNFYNYYNNSSTPTANITLTLSNTSGTLNNIVVHDDLPMIPGTPTQILTNPIGGFNPASQGHAAAAVANAPPSSAEVIWTIPTLSAGPPATLSFNVTLPASDKPQVNGWNQINNFAQVWSVGSGGPVTNSTPGNMPNIVTGPVHEPDEAEATLYLYNQPPTPPEYCTGSDLWVVKKPTEEACSGSSCTFNITVTAQCSGYSQTPPANPVTGFSGPVVFGEGVFQVPGTTPITDNITSIALTPPQPPLPAGATMSSCTTNATWSPPTSSPSTCIANVTLPLWETILFTVTVATPTPTGEPPNANFKNCFLADGMHPQPTSFGTAYSQVNPPTFPTPSPSLPAPNGLWGDCAPLTVAAGVVQRPKCPEGQTAVAGKGCVPIAKQCPPPMISGATPGSCICPPPMISAGAPNTCVCPEGTQLQGKECVPIRKICPPPMISGAAPGSCICPPPMISGAAPNTCVCPEGMQLQGKECVPIRKICPPPMIAGAAPNSCICPPPMIAGPTPNSCVCPQGTKLQGKECVRQIVCKLPQVANAAGTACECPQGTVLRGNECVRPIVCRPPLSLNPAGTACTCPQGTVQRGNECVRSGPGGAPGRGGEQPGGGGRRQ